MVKTKGKGKGKSSLAGKGEPGVPPFQAVIDEEQKAKLAQVAQGADQATLALPEEGKVEEGKAEPGGEPGAEPKKRRARKKKVESSPQMMEAIKPLISLPVNTLLTLAFGSETVPLTNAEKSQLAQATDVLFNKWFPVLIEKWSEEFALGIILVSIFSKRLIIKTEMEVQRKKREGKPVEEKKEEERVEGTE